MKRPKFAREESSKRPCSIFNEGDACYDFPWGYDVLVGKQIHEPTGLLGHTLIFSATEGYKVYWENGAQIIPPHDAKMAALIEENLEPWESLADVEGVLKHPLCKDPKACDAFGGLLNNFLDAVSRVKLEREIPASVARLVKHFSGSGLQIVASRGSPSHTWNLWPTLAKGR